MLPSEKLPLFRCSLLAWFGRQGRDLPWRKTKNPYAIWVSEIMLQQTRVAAVVPYYEQFLRSFPNYAALAVADDNQLHVHWAGLGYYRRVRMMRAAAAEMVALGAFPDEHDAILKLPGIGPYTAAAIASIAFNKPHAVVDGNVLRVVSRLFADADTDRDHFFQHANRLLDRQRPGDFNQAMMELGATVCLPGNPQCLVCPVSEFCQAKAQARQREFPAKKAKPKSVKVERTVYWIEEKGKVLAWQRPADARLMPGFWELPEQAQLPGLKKIETLGQFKHGITFHAYEITVCSAKAPMQTGPCRWLPISELANFPLSTIFKKGIPKRRERVRSAVVGK